VLDCQSGTVLTTYPLEYASLEEYPLALFNNWTPFFSPDGKHLAVANDEISLFPLSPEGKQASIYVDGFCRAACYTQDGNDLFAAEIDRHETTFRILEMRDGFWEKTGPVRKIYNFTSGNVLRFAKDDSFAISTGGRLIRWDFDWKYEYEHAEICT